MAALAIVHSRYFAMLHANAAWPVPPQSSKHACAWPDMGFDVVSLWALMWCYIAQGLDREHACGACRGGVLAQYQEHFRAFRSLPSPNRSELEAIATSRSRVASSVTMKGRGSRTGSRRSGGQ
jgi:hypothetical protein